MSPVRVTVHRAANQVDPNPERLESSDGSRWATGRNVKRHLADRRFDVVQVWTLKRRGATGKAEIVETHRDRAAALAWVRD